MDANRRAAGFLVLSSALLVILAGANVAQAESLGAWTATTPYPLQLAAAGCSVVGDYVYCVGGFDTNLNSYDNVYYAQVNATGIGQWATGTVYPTAVDSESCVSVTTTIYCVGGEDGQGALNDVYYTQIQSATSAPGPWSEAAVYPEPTVVPACVVSGSYLYCTGGFDSNGNEVSSSYYAPLGSPGIDEWSSTTSYPKAVDSQACVTADGYIFCVAGEVASGGNNVPINNVYYAQLTSSGIGKWSSGPVYPASLTALSCVAYSGYIYCVGGFDSNGLSSTDAYYAPISSSGVGQWTSTSAYPVAIDTEPCVAYSSDMFCIGGVNGLTSGINNVNYSYYVSLGGTTAVTTTPEFPVAAAIPIVLGAALGAAALGLRKSSP